MASSYQPQQVSEEIKKKYTDILKANGILDKVKTISAHEPEELIGEHMATGSLYVHIEFEDPSKKPKNLFVKHFLENSAHTELIKESRLMEKESSFFTEFLPDARKFCSKYPGSEKFLDGFPKCLYGDDEIVVLENVVLDDTFTMLRKEELQDLYTAKFVLNNLAKFHATTFAMIEEKEPERFRSKYELLILELLMSKNSAVVANMFDGGLNTCITVLKGNPVPGADETIETLGNCIGKAFDMTKDNLLYNEKDKINVVNHGDFWNNNMLFKKDPATGKVVEHMFVDLQCTRMGSPNLDVGYFLFTTVQPLIRQNHLEELLQHYFDSFGKTLEVFGKKCPMTFEEFSEDYRKRFFYGFFFHLNMMCGREAFKDMDMNEMGDDDNAWANMFNNAIRNWMKKNPVKVSKIAVEIVAATNEFLKLTSKN